MKFGFPKDKNGNVIKVATLDTKIFDENGKSVADKIRGIESRVNYMYKSIEYLQDAVTQLESGGSGGNDNPFKDVTLRSDSTENICLLSDNNGVVTSEYGYTYDILGRGLDSGNFSEYIKDGDWIELTLSNGDYFKMYANVDTYYGESDGTTTIGHHIDFISKDLIPGSVGNNGSYNTADGSWRMRDGAEGTNNGSDLEGSPFLASTKKYKKDGKLIGILESYYYNFPTELKSYISKKRHNVPIRQNSSSSSTSNSLTTDTGTKWEDMGFLWIPYEREIFGSNTYGGNYESHMKQYHSFANITDFKLKSDNKYMKNSPWSWWVASARSGDKKSFCTVNSGESAYNSANEQHIGAPLCFRFQNNYFKDITRDTQENVCLLKDNNGVVTSDYGYTYDILVKGLNTGNFANYIKDGDWIELTAANGDEFKLYANVDTYFGQGENGKIIGHHIDFISKDLIPGSVGSSGSYNNELDSWRMRNATLHNNGTNNGSNLEGSPFLASTRKYKSDGVLIDKMNTYYNSYIPSSIKDYVVKKYHNVPIRQNSSSSTTSKDLTNDTGTKWEDMGYLWIPYEREIFNSYHSDYEPHMKQYHSFANITDFKKKSDVKYGANNPCTWWTASAYAGNSESFYNVSSSGISSGYNANYFSSGVPLCFRLQYYDDDPFGYTEGVTMREDQSSNICLLKDNNGEVTSDYGYTYDKLAGILDGGNYSSYIKDGDWIELTTADGATYKMYANIDTYYGTGPAGREIGHHIDFISDNLIYGSTSRTNGSNNYSSTNINSWRMNGISGGSSYPVKLEPSPFLANSTQYRGDTGGIIDKLDAYYNSNIPNGLKGHIIKKYHKVPTRYDGTFYAVDYGDKWAYLPYLWIPYRKEVEGTNASTYESDMKQYHSFANIDNFKVKTDKKDIGSTSYSWWTASAVPNDGTNFYAFDSTGKNLSYNSNIWYCGTPLCFRFQ